MTSLRPTAWIQATSAVAVFVAWTLTSFLCHECGKKFLELSDLVTSNSEQRPFHRFCLAFVLTTVQCVACLLFVRYEDANTGMKSSLTLLRISHVLATLATNYSMAYIEAASTLAIKLTEPVTMAVFHHMIFKTAVPPQTALSIPLIIAGALVFTGNSLHHISGFAGISLAFASNIILAARNITLKKLQSGADSTTNSPIVLKPFLKIATIILYQSIFVAGVFFLEFKNFLPRNCSLLAGLSLTSGFFHVAYSYISTSIVLKVMNVISHSIANIFKRFVVVMLLSALGTRIVSATNFLGLLVAVGGLLVYANGKAYTEDQPREFNERKVNFRVPLARSLCLVLSIIALVSVGCLGLASQQAINTSATKDVDHNIYREKHGLYELQTPSTDFSHILKAETDPEMREFLSWRLVDHPEDTDKRAKTLTNNEDVIEEAQRILVNLLEDLLGKAKHVMLIEIATYENKGDPAITVGEVMLLRRMNITIVYYCETFTCLREESVRKAQELNKNYAKDEVVILLQGGGNFGVNTIGDRVRQKYIDTFPDRQIVMFSQSFMLPSMYPKHVEYCRSIYSNHSNLVLFMRDRQSLEVAKANFQGVKLILAPDLAFCIGMVPRQLPPLYDVVWLKRKDKESSGYALPLFSSDILVNVSDWNEEWLSNKAQTDMERSFLVAAVGFQFLQRGRIVVTDRLHGHILSTLMNIPHVLIDNPPHLKLSSFDRSWTQSLSNTILVHNGTLALDAARELLTGYHHSLPSLVTSAMYSSNEL